VKKGKFDMHQGFWQAPLAEPSQNNTEVEQTIGDDLLASQIIVYIDDPLVFAENDEAYLQTPRLFFAQLRKHKLKINPMKSVLHQD
ncbi:TPA: hypothetical protein N0F65_006045, partial [Lagenidium giganteum]